MAHSPWKEEREELGEPELVREQVDPSSLPWAGTRPEGFRIERVLYQSLPGVRVPEEDELRAYDPELLSFVDCNTPERYREALELAGLESEP